MYPLFKTDPDDISDDFDESLRRSSDEVGTKRSRSASSSIDGVVKRSRGVSPQTNSLFVPYDASEVVATTSENEARASRDQVRRYDETSEATPTVNGVSTGNESARENEVNPEGTNGHPTAKSFPENIENPPKTSTEVSTANNLARENQEHPKSTPNTIEPERYMPTLDSNGRVPGYDASKEGLPHCGYYSKDFRQAEVGYQRACNVVLDKYGEISGRGYLNQAIDNVCGPSGLARYRNPSDHYDVPGPVAALGPAGSGKSSATNSIMSQQKVAFEHDGDDRGTYLVHEYRSAPSDQLTKYRVVATYYSEQDIKRDIVTYHHAINTFLFSDDDEPLDDEVGLEQKYRTALCFFMDLLAHRNEFQTEEAVEKYFTDNGDEELPAACDELYDFVDEFVQSREFYSDGEERYNVNSEVELQAIFKQVCRPSKARGSKVKEGSPWPIIRKIVVHQDVGVLNVGVILADTPGFNDQNLAVVQNTMRYLKVAGTVLIYLTYKRIDQNSPLDQLLREVMAVGKRDHVRLVVTSIDEMKPLDVDDMDAEGRGCLQAAKTKLQRILSEVKETEAAKKRAKGVDSTKFEEADGRLESLQLLKIQAAAALKQVNIEIRCRDMRASLKGRIQAIDKWRGAPELPISFISNTQYQLHVRGYDPKESDPREAPFLDLEATGIPQLRRELLTIAAGGKMRVLKNLASNALPTMLNGITGILTKSKLERIAEVRKIVNKVTLKHDEPVRDLVADIVQAYEKQIVSTIAINLEEWRDGAQAALSKWRTIPPATFKGFCSRAGEWSSHSKYGHFNFKSELCDISAKQLSLAFNRLGSDLADIKKTFSLNVQDLFDGLCRDIKNSKDAQGNVLDPFFGFIKGTASEIVKLVIHELDALEEKLDQIRCAATLNTEGSYFWKGMSATYVAATLLSAKTHVPQELPSAPKITAGGTRRLRAKKSTVGSARLQIISNKFRGEAGEESIFLSIGQLAKEVLDGYLKVWAVRCNDHIEKGYEKIVENFNARFQEDEVKEEADPIAVDQLKEAVKQASKHLEDAKLHVAKCEAYEERGK